MRTLYHFPLCPFSRKIRVLLAEKYLDFELIAENFWEYRESFARLNPAMEVPVLVEPDGAVICSNYAICEYIEDKYNDKPLISSSLDRAAEVRRLVAWFDTKFYYEVNRYLLNEKVIRYYTNIGAPLSEALRAVKVNIKTHMEYINFLLEENKFLSGEKMMLNDIAAATQLSVADYFSAVSWAEYPKVKQWYSVIKSRPSFRSILGDRIKGFLPAKHYANLDF